VILLPQLTTATGAGGATFELQAYLTRLGQQAEQAVDIAPCFESVHQRQRWQAKTQVLMMEMVAFLQVLARFW